MADVFISYARATESAARRIAEKLRSLGHSVWFDEELPPHRAYSEVISEKLEEAKAVVVVWSSAASASNWVRSEASRALEKGTLVQVNVDGSRLPMPFDQIQFVDLRSWRGNQAAPAWQKVVASITELVAGEVRPLQPAASEKQIETMGRRRVLLAGAAAAALGVGGFFIWSMQRHAELPPEAGVLLQKALTIMQDGRPAEQDQAIAYLIEVTRIAPDFPNGWGTLALAYAIRKFHGPIQARPGDDARCRSAARAALDLDADEPVALCALALLIPPYRNWRRVEQMGKDLTRRFSHPPLVFHIFADLLADVGRWSESVNVYRRINRKRFFIPLSDRSIIQALWNAGDIQGAEAMLEEAVRRWPQHHAIWDLRTQFLTHSGRADEAVRLLENADVRPSGYPEDLHRVSLITARAMAGSVRAEEAIGENLLALDRTPSEVLTYLNRKLTLGQVVAQRCAALGDAGTAFALLDGYYRGSGKWARLAPAAGNADRSTVALFEAPMQSIWRDTRFRALMNDIGLEGYWRESRSTPDFRSAGRRLA